MEKDNLTPEQPHSRPSPNKREGGFHSIMSVSPSDPVLLGTMLNIR